MSPEGLNFKFEYDNYDISRVINAISPMGMVNTNVYSNGNPIANRISNINDEVSLESNLYRIRLKGKEKYIGSDCGEIVVKNNIYCTGIWNVIKEGDYYKINHAICPTLFVTVQNNSLVLSNYDNDYSLFIIEEKDNGSYTIKNKGNNKYIKADTNILMTQEEDNYSFEFYFEKVNNKNFIESNIFYTNDGNYVNKTLDNNLNETCYIYNTSNGLLLSETNPKGILTEYTHDNKNRVIRKKINKRKIDYSYNANNQINEIVNGDRIYTVTHDNFYKIKKISINNIPLISALYDNQNGNMVSIIYGK